MITGLQLMEEIIISLLLSGWRENVKGIFQVLKRKWNEDVKQPAR